METHSFGVLHILKYKGSLGGIGAHIDRIHIPENVNPNKVGFNESIRPRSSLKLVDLLGSTIDRSKSELNEEYHSNKSQPLEAAVWNRIEEGHLVKSKIRRDAVLALGVILTGSHERMLAIQADPTQFAAWKQANYNFACKTFGKENIVRFTLHLDEKTPHIHCVVVPIAPSGRLSATHFIDGKARLRAYQDAYAQAMAPFGLARGIPSTLTHRAHITTQEYYKSIRSIVQKTEQLTQSIKATNIFKLENVRQQVQENLTQLQVAYQALSHQLSYAQTTNRSLVEGQEQQVYQQQLREKSRGAYEWIKREIPLIPFATAHLGWEVDKNKSSKQEIVLNHPAHGRINVSTCPKLTTGHWVYSHEKGGGTLIDLLIKDNWSWEKIRSLAREHGFDQTKVSTSVLEPLSQPTNVVNSAIKVVDEEDPIAASRQEQSPLDRTVETNRNPFFSNRSIEKATYQGLNGLEVSKQTAVFWLYKALGEKGQRQLCGSITYYQDRLGKQEKYFQKSLQIGLSVLSSVTSLQAAKQFVITQRPIDALSYRQLASKGIEGWRRVVGIDNQPTPYHPHDTVYLSTCGYLTSHIKKELESVFQLAYARGGQVVIALDNDQLGRKMTQTLIHMVEKVGARYQIEIPTQGENWSDTLTQPLDKAQNETLTTQELAAKQWELFEGKAYQNTILPLLGVKETTLADFQQQVKSNEQSLLVALRPLEKKVAQTNKLVTNNSIEVSSLESEKAILATWSLQIDQPDGIKTPPPDSLPPVALLKGNLAEAKQVILVSSPLDALLHYQTIHKKHTQSSNHLSSDILGASKQRLAATCYVYVGKDRASSLQQPLGELFKVVPTDKVNLVLASSNKVMVNQIETILQKYGRPYTKEKVLPYRHARVNPLASSLSMLDPRSKMNLPTKEAVAKEDTMTKKKARKLGNRPNL